MTRNFPEFFAILRDGIRSPSLQVLRSYPCDYNRNMRRTNAYRGYYEVSNIDNVEEFDGRLLPAPSAVSRDRTIYLLHTFHPDTAEPLEVYYWFTPYVLEGHRGTIIPLLEFQYRSWIPTGYTPLPIRANLNEVYACLSQIQQERLDEIRRREDNDSIQTPPRNYYNIPMFEPRHYNDDPHERWMQNSRRGSRVQTPPPPPPPVARIIEVPVERVVERIIVQQRVLPLPKDVGNLLLSNARKGADSCPIAATPFSECESLCVSSCFHIFDAASLARWQESHTSCPVCRSKIENVVIEDRPNGMPAV